MLQEIEVRRAAQQIIADHLCLDEAEGARWQEIDFVDLSGARLFFNFSLADCRVSCIQVNGTIFEGETLFRGFHCGAMFASSTVFFKGFADFRGAVFKNDAWLSWARFEGGAMFNADNFYAGAILKGGQVSNILGLPKAPIFRVPPFRPARTSRERSSMATFAPQA